MALTSTPQPDLNDHDGHTVGFYETDGFLIELVAGFIRPAIDRDETAFVVMTTEHQRRLGEALEADGVDVDGALRRGQLVFIEAHGTRRRLISGGELDPERFRSITDELFAHASTRGRPVRIFGYMVALFWEEGDVATALALEDLWNDLARVQPFELLCAHPMRAFSGPGSDDAFRSVCQRHSAMANESYGRLGEPGTTGHTVVVLQREGLTTES